MDKPGAEKHSTILIQASNRKLRVLFRLIGTFFRKIVSFYPKKNVQKQKRVFTFFYENDMSVLVLSYRKLLIFRFRLIGSFRKKKEVSY